VTAGTSLAREARVLALVQDVGEPVHESAALAGVGNLGQGLQEQAGDGVGAQVGNALPGRGDVLHLPRQRVRASMRAPSRTSLQVSHMARRYALWACAMTCLMALSASSTGNGAGFSGMSAKSGTGPAWWVGVVLVPSAIAHGLGGLRTAPGSP
jgi:hypothetical protein